MWLALFFSVPVAGLFLAFTISLDHSIQHKPYHKRFYQTVCSTTWLTFGAMVHQGTAAPAPDATTLPVHVISPGRTLLLELDTIFTCVLPGSEYKPRCQASKLMIGCWWFVSTVIAATYTG